MAMSSLIRLIRMTKNECGDYWGKESKKETRKTNKHNKKNPPYTDYLGIKEHFFPLK